MLLRPSWTRHHGRVSLQRLAELLDSTSNAWPMTPR